MSYIVRKIGDELRALAETRPAVLLTGIRQSGKSTLLGSLFPEARYVSFDHYRVAEHARENTESFFDQLGEGTVILDEIQYVPEVFREMKIRIDRDRQRYGRFLLTGSQKFPLLESARESLAGRVALLDLQTLGCDELRKTAPDQAIGDILWKGGFPELWANPAIDPERFLDDYISTYLEKDLRAVLQVVNLPDFHKLLRACALRAGSLVNYADLARDLGISPNTAKSWISGLVRSGILTLLEPWFANLSKRLARTPKLYFCDQGLLCHLLNIGSLKNLTTHPLYGAVWENFVFGELIRHPGVIPGRNLFFYRDQNQVEVDFLFENGQDLILLEAKTAERPDPKTVGITKVARAVPDRTVRGICCCPVPEPGLYSGGGFASMNPLLTGFSGVPGLGRALGS